MDQLVISVIINLSNISYYRRCGEVRFIETLWQFGLVRLVRETHSCSCDGAISCLVKAMKSVFHSASRLFIPGHSTTFWGSLQLFFVVVFWATFLFKAQITLEASRPSRLCLDSC